MFQVQFPPRFESKMAEYGSPSTAFSMKVLTMVISGFTVKELVNRLAGSVVMVAAGVAVLGVSTAVTCGLVEVPLPPVFTTVEEQVKEAVAVRGEQLKSKPAAEVNVALGMKTYVAESPPVAV